MDKDDCLKSIIESIRKLDYIDPDDIPNIDLYMDQVTTFMDEHLKSSKRFNEDKLLTKTMINNYTKNNLLPSPNKKKYSKEHLLMLTFIYYFKNLLSISDIQSIFNPLTEKYYGGKSSLGLEEIYKEIFSYERDQMDNLIKDVIRKYNKSMNTFKEVESEKDRDFLNNFAFICMLSFDVYIKKQMIEKIIDDSIIDKKKVKRDKPKE
jgi:DNA-binding transcriptional MerR regulator